MEYREISRQNLFQSAKIFVIFYLLGIGGGFSLDYIFLLSASVGLMVDIYDQRTTAMIIFSTVMGWLSVMLFYHKASLLIIVFVIISVAVFYALNIIKDKKSGTKTRT